MLLLGRGRSGCGRRSVLHERRLVEEGRHPARARRAARCLPCGCCHHGLKLAARAARRPTGCRRGRRRRQHGAEVLVDEGGRLG